MSFMKALIITWENFQDQEVVYPYYRLKEETDDVKIISNVGRDSRPICSISVGLICSAMEAPCSAILSRFWW